MVSSDFDSLHCWLTTRQPWLIVVNQFQPVSVDSALVHCWSTKEKILHYFYRFFSLCFLVKWYQTNILWLSVRWLLFLAIEVLLSAAVIAWGIIFEPSRKGFIGKTERHACNVNIYLVSVVLLIVWWGKFTIWWLHVPVTEFAFYLKS
jgi:phosphate starvation-inducible membrane PsiE